MNTLVKSGKKLSFFELFTTLDLAVEIPIIQRDYAQGRKSAKEVRSKFLDALFDYLESGIPGRDLDFVYGSISEVDGKKIFIPLDGQQRLTTLFLLHWYLAILGDRKHELESKLAQDKKSRFTYETRTSAREFCDVLMSQPLNYEYNQAGNISTVIKNMPWYYLSWKYDPTIQGMLTMLNAIEEKFHQHPHFFNCLIDLERPIITFQFLDLKEFQLTDDLYIKMNSRGKPLTSFENFKAKLEQKIKELFKDEGSSFELTMGGEARALSAHDYFSHKIDTIWLNYFWKASGKDSKRVDSQMMNFIRVILANSYAIAGTNITVTNLKALLEKQVNKNRDGEQSSLTFFDFDELGAINKNIIESLIHAFDQALASDNLESDNLPNPFHYDHKGVFRKVITYDISTQERLLFHAFLNYLILYPGKLEGLKEWMRVMYNLTENTRIEDAEDIYRGIQETESLLSNAPEILLSLSNPAFNIGFFYSRQIEEERIKACLLLKGGEWSKLIRKIEKHSFFKGQIGFLLEFSGILDYYKDKKDCQWDTNQDNQFRFSLANYIRKAMYVFSWWQGDENKDFLWERTVLSKGDYLISSTYWRKNFLSVRLMDRDNSWKRLLRLNRASDPSNAQLKDKRFLVKEVFDDEHFDVNHFVQSCNQIIKETPDDWRAYFIKNPALIKVCGRGFIRLQPEEPIKLLTKTRLTYYYELKTYNLYLNNIEGKSFLPFKETTYSIEYGLDGVSHIFIGSWCFQRKEYQAILYFDELNKFSLEFSKSKGKNKEEDYAEELQRVLQGLKFSFDLDMWRGYYITAKTAASILKYLKDLCDSLLTLDK